MTNVQVVRRPGSPASRALWFAAMLLACSGCSGVASQASDADRDQASARPLSLADYESFDAQPYAEAPPSPRPEVSHDAPEGLLSGRFADQGATITRAGYRIQILSTQDKDEADHLAVTAAAWWRAQRQSGALEEAYPREEKSPPVYQDFHAPYYRVRLGNFLSRDDAVETLRIVEKRFASAFIAPGRIQIEE